MNTTFIENLKDIYDIDANKIIDELLKLDYNIIINDLRDPRVIYIIPKVLNDDLTIYIKKILEFIGNYFQ
jgi:hypothetical protein